MVRTTSKRQLILFERNFQIIKLSRIALFMRLISNTNMSELC